MPGTAAKGINTCWTKPRSRRSAAKIDIVEPKAWSNISGVEIVGDRKSKEAASKNLADGLCKNDNDKAGGAVALPGAGRISFTKMDRAAGYPKAREFQTLPDEGKL